MSSEYVLEILRGLRSLAGSDVFDTCVQTLQGLPTTVSTNTKKERKPHAVDPEKSAKRSADMTALQTFIKSEREKAGEGAVYKEVQKSAGARWKAMSEEEKTVWKASVVPSLDTTKNVTVSTEAVDTKLTKVSVKAVKSVPVPSETETETTNAVVKKAGRPPKKV